MSNLEHPVETSGFSPKNYSTGLTPLVVGDAVNPDAPNPDLVVNGDFATDAIWTKGAGWAINPGVGAVRTPSAATDLSQVIAGLDLNAAYLVATTITGRTAGTVTPKFGTTAGNALNADGTFYDIIPPQSGSLIYTPDAAFDGTIVSSKAIKVLEAQVVLKADQGVLYSLHGHNNLGSAQYIMIFKLGAAAAEGDIPFRSIQVPAEQDYELVLPKWGDHSLNGWYVCNSTTEHYKTLGAPDCTFVAQYK